jgi:hypothetical protein
MLYAQNPLFWPDMRQLLPKRKLCQRIAKRFDRNDGSFTAYSTSPNPNSGTL